MRKFAARVIRYMRRWAGRIVGTLRRLGVEWHRRWLLARSKARQEPGTLSLVIAADPSDAQIRRIDHALKGVSGHILVFGRRSFELPFPAVIYPFELTREQVVATALLIVRPTHVSAIRIVDCSGSWTKRFRLKALQLAQTVKSGRLPRITGFSDDDAEPSKGADSLQLNVAGVETRGGLVADFRPLSSARFGSLVTVVVTIHNEADCIGRAIGSIQRQTYRRLEIIVVDDASTDDSCKIVAEMAAHDKRIKLLRLESNVGTYQARNHGMRAASGEFLTFHDADDLSRVDRVDRCVHNVGDADYLLANYIRVNADGSVRPISPGNVHRQGLITLFMSRRRVIETAGFFDNVKAGADSEYVERLSALGLRRKEIPDVLYYAELRPNSLTTAGSLRIFRDDGAHVNNKYLRDYVDRYREYHARGVNLRHADDGAQRKWLVPLQLLAGEQSRWLRSVLPGLGDCAHPLYNKHAVAMLCGRSCHPGLVSLRRLLDQSRSHRDVYVIAATKRVDNIDNIIDNFVRQSYPNKRLVVVDNCLESSAARIAQRLESRGVAADIHRVEVPNRLGRCLNEAIARFVPPNAIVTKFDDDDYYGHDYVVEQVAVLETGCDLVGKLPIFYYCMSTKRLYLRPKNKDSIAHVKHVSGATLTFAKSTWSKCMFDEELSSGCDADFVQRIVKSGRQVVSTSIFNFCAYRGRVADHTWTISKDIIFDPAVAEIIYEQVEWRQVGSLVSTNWVTM